MTVPNIPSGGEKELSAKQRQAALLLASGSTIASAAGVVGCNEKSIDTWKKLPLFKDAMRQAEDDLYGESLATLKRQLKPAIDCLVRNMSGKVSNYVQVNAAGKLLDAGMEAHTIRVLEQRIAELEEIVLRGKQ